VVGVSITGDCVFSDIDSSLVQDLDTSVKVYSPHLTHVGAKAGSSVIDNLNRDLCLTVHVRGPEASDPTLVVGVSVTDERVDGPFVASVASPRGRTCPVGHAVGSGGQPCSEVRAVGCKSASSRSACNPLPSLPARSLPAFQDHPRITLRGSLYNTFILLWYILRGGVVYGKTMNIRMGVWSSVILHSSMF
jgi:hypothetical protein